MQRRSFIGAAALAALGMCAQTSAQTPESTPVGDTRTIAHSLGTTEIPANPQRIVALGEEFLLADLLELGVKPIASSANYIDGYIGIDPALTEGLEPFILWEADIEALIMLQPDLVLIPETILAFAPEVYEAMSQFTPVVPLPDDEDWRGNFVFLASVFGKESLALSIVEELEANIETARTELALDGQTVTIATVYPGGTDITLWLTEQSQWVELAQGIGLTVVPSAEGYEVDQLGRTPISLEQANLIQGETLIMPQTSGNAGAEEQVSFDEVASSDIWQTVPAVQNDRVFVLERVGFPGEIPGRRNLLAEYREIFEA